MKQKKRLSASCVVCQKLKHKCVGTEAPCKACVDRKRPELCFFSGETRQHKTACVRKIDHDRLQERVLQIEALLREQLNLVLTPQAPAQLSGGGAPIPIPGINIFSLED